MRGYLFDLKEFALNDGGGIRTTVFFKGCPLRCIWCHNPEGLDAVPQLYEKQNGCLHCNLCRRPCSHPECQPFGRCMHICPKNLLHIVGTAWDVEELADRLLKKKEQFDLLGGGVTFSGGEPLLQWEFLTEVLKKLKGNIHITLETSGYADPVAFQTVTKLCDFVYMDLKLMDGEMHKKYTGVSNEKILKNADWLKHSGISYCFRTPLIPGITDVQDNLNAVAKFAENSPVELLPYNPLAGAKYAGVGKTFTTEIHVENENKNIDLSPFHKVIVRK